MCEIFGATFDREVRLNEYLKEFYSHSDHHPHGWGLACLDGDEVMLEKEPMQASKSHYLRERLSVPIEENAVLAHIRYATIGNLLYKNCHPFTAKDEAGRRWTLVHNGTIFSYSPLNAMIQKQKGTTDSERILLYIISRVNEMERYLGRLSFPEERNHLINGIICDMAEGNKLNLLFYDGEQMYVHTNFRGSLHYLKKPGGVIFATSPLSSENWKDVPFTRLLVFQAGQPVFTGTDHGHEYIENEEDMRMIYMAYADL